MSSDQVADKFRTLRRDIRALEAERDELLRRAKEPHLMETVAARFRQQAADKQTLIDQKEQDIVTLRNSIQLDLFKSQS